MSNATVNPETQCVHAGTIPDETTGGVNSPVFTSTACEYIDRESQIYPRYFNAPNQLAVIRKICALEHAEDGVLFASGMAAISTTLLALAKPGDHLVMQEEVYGGSNQLAVEFLEHSGFEISFAPATAEALIDACCAKTAVLYFESPTNPLIKVVDIERVAAFTRERGIVSVIDSTFATPILQNPIDLGTDVVVHSGTKYFGGHSDLTCGVVATSGSLADKIRARAKQLGGSLNSQMSVLLERSLKTLSLRVERQAANAAKIAGWLDRHTAVSRVHYPGLAKSPNHELARKQMRQFGAMLAFELAGGSPDAFLSRLALIRPALSLGGVESVICVPAQTSHVSMSTAERARLGISPDLLRLSVGIEHVDDLIADIEQAL